MIQQKPPYQQINTHNNIISHNQQKEYNQEPQDRNSTIDVLEYYILYLLLVLPPEFIPISQYSE